MKKVIVLGMIGAMALCSCGDGSTGSKAPKTEIDSVSYAIGMDIGNNLKNLKDDIDVKMLAQALNDAFSDNGKMTQEEAYVFLNEYFSVRKPAKALKESEDFLAGKEGEANILKTESGLLYEIITEGGEKAMNDADTVTVIYTGTLPDGTVFDSTEMHGTENDSFPLNGVIPAWTEGMKLVGKGGKIKLYAHPDLAYGPRQASPQIGPNQALIFDVEIVDIKPAVEE